MFIVIFRIEIAQKSNLYVNRTKGTESIIDTIDNSNDGSATAEKCDGQIVSPVVRKQVTHEVVNIHSL